MIVTVATGGALGVDLAAPDTNAVLSAVGQAVAPATSSSPGGTFFDDDGDVHEGAIEAIVAAGITRGCGEPDLYCPTDPVTRGQMAAFLARALNLPAAKGDTFSDDDGSMFEADIQALAAAGITRGCGPRLFCPDRVVTRQEMAAFLTRALHLEPGESDRFVDDAGSPFAADISALARAGITKGCNPPANDLFCPTRPVLRDQMASFLSRALDLTPVIPPPRPSVTMAFTGDVLIHSQLWRKAATYGSPFDFGPMFAPVSKIIGSVDLAICHLETPLSATDEDLSSYPRFNTPHEVADGLAGAGYDGCSTASNHSWDQGLSGIEATVKGLHDAGLAQSGMATSQSAADHATLYQVGDVTLAHIAATWWLNGLRLPEDKPWLVQMLDLDQILAKAHQAREEGADVVVVSMHCCVQYQAAPTAYQKEVARALIASPDVDLVVGHHAHVVSPVEEVNGEYIFYGLGNFLSGQRFLPETQDGVILTVEFAPRNGRWVGRNVRAYPTWVEAGTYRILTAAGNNEASWRRTARTLESYGADLEVVG
ncbi:MAG: CapA family protein [Acidimicrobiia bacterium]